MKKIVIEYTIELDEVINYWQSKLEELWAKKQKMDEEIEMIDNTITYLNALKEANSNQVRVIVCDESEKGN